MPRWEQVLVKTDTGLTLGDAGPKPTYSAGTSYWAVVGLLSAEAKEKAGITLTERVYAVRFRDTPAVSMRSSKVVLTDRAREILDPIAPSANADGYGRDTVIVARDTGRLEPVPT